MPEGGVHICQCRPARWIVWLRILLGLTLLVLAWRKWQGRAAPGDAEDVPGWMKSIDTIHASRAALLGFALVTLNPKNVVLVASGGLAIAQATPDPLAQVLGVSGLPGCTQESTAERIGQPLNAHGAPASSPPAVAVE